MLSIQEISLSGALLIAAVLLVRAAGRGRLPKAALPVLWWVALCRLLLPFRLPSPTSVYAAADRLGVEQLRPGLLLHGTNLPAEALAAGTAEAALAVKLPAALVWGLAALGLALCFLIPHLRYMRRCRDSLPEESPLVRAWMAAHPLRRPVRVRRSDRIDAPFTCGVLRPVIYLPKELDRSNGDRLAFVLAHELAHIRRWDALTKWLLAVCLCVHWFNPLVWVMYLLAVRDLELACDEAVVRQYGPATRADYALTLVALEEKRARFAPLCSSFSKNALEERIASIMKHKKLTAAGIGTAAVLAVALIAVFATQPPAPAQSAVHSAPSTSLDWKSFGITQAIPGEEIHTTVAVTENGGWWEERVDGEPIYTQDEYNIVCAGLMMAGWPDMSIADYNRGLNAAFQTMYESGEGSYEAYEKVICSITQDDPMASYLLNTVQASRNEYQARLDEVYTRKTVDPSFSATAYKEATADVFGEQMRTACAYAYYSFTYRILDQDGLTVAERDEFLQKVMQGAQDYLDSLTMDQLIDGKDGRAGFRKALEAAGEQASTSEISFTGCKVDTVEGYYESY